MRESRFTAKIDFDKERILQEGYTEEHVWSYVKKLFSVYGCTEIGKGIYKGRDGDSDMGSIYFPVIQMMSEEKIRQMIKECKVISDTEIDDIMLEMKEEGVAFGKAAV